LICAAHLEITVAIEKRLETPAEACAMENYMNGLLPKLNRIDDLLNTWKQDLLFLLSLGCPLEED